MLEARTFTRQVEYKGKVIFFEEAFYLTEESTPKVTMCNQPDWQDFNYCVDLWNYECGFTTKQTRFGTKIIFDKKPHWYSSDYIYAKESGKSDFVFSIWETTVKPTVKQIVNYPNQKMMIEYFRQHTNYYKLHPIE